MRQNGIVPGRVVTRADAAYELGVSRATIRRWEGQLLHPVVGQFGVREFDAAEIRALAAQRPRRSRRPKVQPPGREAPPRRSKGQRAALLFRIFEHNPMVDLRQVVITAEEEPRFVYACYRDWSLNELDPRRRAMAESTHEEELRGLRGPLGLRRRV